MAPIYGEINKASFISDRGKSTDMSNMKGTLHYFNNYEISYSPIRERMMAISSTSYLFHVICTTSFSMSSASPFSKGSAIMVILFLSITSHDCQSLIREKLGQRQGLTMTITSNSAQTPIQIKHSTFLKLKSMLLQSCEFVLII